MARGDIEDKDRAHMRRGKARTYRGSFYPLLIRNPTLCEGGCGLGSGAAEKLINRCILFIGSLALPALGRLPPFGWWGLSDQKILAHTP
jgi:hypothetical protein